MVIKTIIYLANKNWIENQGTAWYINTFLDLAMYTNIRLVVLHIIIDRFIDIKLSIKYPLYITLKKLQSIVISMWMISVIFALLWTIILKLDVLKLSSWYAYVSAFIVLADILIVVSAVVTYTYLFSRVRKFTHTNGQQDLTRTSLIIRKFKIPCLMVLTFIMFNVSGTVLRVCGIRDIPHVLDLLGWCSDSYLYILTDEG